MLRAPRRDKGNPHRARRYDRRHQRAEIAKHVVLLRDKGYVDLEALPPPANKEVAIADG